MVLYELFFSDSMKIEREIIKLNKERIKDQFSNGEKKDRQMFELTTKIMEV